MDIAELLTRFPWMWAVNACWTLRTDLIVEEIRDEALLSHPMMRVDMEQQQQDPDSRLLYVWFKGFSATGPGEVWRAEWEDVKRALVKHAFSGRLRLLEIILPYQSECIEAIAVRSISGYRIYRIPEHLRGERFHRYCDILGGRQDSMGTQLHLSFTEASLTSP